MSCVKLQNHLVSDGIQWPKTRSGLTELMRALFTEINHHLVHPLGECSRLTKPDRWQISYYGNTDYQRTTQVAILMVIPDDQFRPLAFSAAYDQMPLRPEFEMRFKGDDTGNKCMRVGCPEELLACDDYTIIRKFRVTSASYFQTHLERRGLNREMLIVLDETLSSMLARGFVCKEWDYVDPYCQRVLEESRKEFTRYFFEQTSKPPITLFDEASAKARAERQAQLDRTVDQEWVPPFVFYVGREIN